MQELQQGRALGARGTAQAGVRGVGNGARAREDVRFRMLALTGWTADGDGHGLGLLVV